MSISIVKVVTKENIQLCYQVRYLVFCDEQHIPRELELDSYDDTCDHWLAIDNSDPITPLPVGTARLVQNFDESGRKVGKIGRVAVISSYRGKGIAKQIMLKMESYASSSSLDRLLLHAQVDKQLFYAKLGYSSIDPNEVPFDEVGNMHVRMHKFIKPSRWNHHIR